MRQPRTTGGRSPAAHLGSARWLLMGLFALNGLIMASWLARLPAVRDALGLSPSDLGLVLLAGAVGALATVMVAGVVVTRFGGRVAMTLSACGSAGAFALLGLGSTLGSVGLLTAGVFLNGVSFALGTVPINVESAAIERRMGRTVLPQFHAAFSIGAVSGSLLGALSAHFEVALLSQFVATAALGAVWRLLTIPHVVLDSVSARELAARVDRDRAAWVLADGGPGVDDRGGPAMVVTAGRVGSSALKGWHEPRTLLIGVVIMAAALSEGSANNWLALAVVDGFGEPAAVGAVVFGLFVASMTVVRLLGTRLIDRWGRVVVLRGSGFVSFVGLLLFVFAPTLELAGVGVVAWGLGAALAVPIGIAAASDDPLRAAGRVSVVSAFASMASLAAPPLLGLAAESLGPRRALVLITVAMVVSVSLSRRVAPTGSADRPREMPRTGADTPPVPDPVPDSTEPVRSGGSDTWGMPVAEDKSAVGVS